MQCKSLRHTRKVTPRNKLQPEHETTKRAVSVKGSEHATVTQTDAFVAVGLKTSGAMAHGVRKVGFCVEIELNTHKLIWTHWTH